VNGACGSVIPLLGEREGPGGEADGRVRGRAVSPESLTLPPLRLPRKLPVLRLLGGMGLGRHDFDYVLERYLALDSGQARQAFLRTLRAGVDVRGQVITMLDRSYLTAGLPTLIVWGEHDGVIPVAHARLAHAMMPGSRLEVFADAGHFPHHDAPEKFVSVLEDFLDSTEPQDFDPVRWRKLLRAGRPDIPLYEEAAPPHPSSGS
jgi:pimeloyl-ACP methyl ester carboxylesterase